jgi:DNA repair exonuclease SbcCD ATPase subunit
VIISKTNLVRGSNDERRQSIIDSLPYFLGVVDEQTVARQDRLRRLRTRLAVKEQQETAQERIRGEERSRALGLMQEAAQVGLVRTDFRDAPLDDLLSALQATMTWTADEAFPASNSVLDPLYEREQELLNRAHSVQRKIRSAAKVASDAGDFSRVATKQHRQLEVVNLFPAEEATTACPLCQQSIEEITDSVETVRQALAQIRGELRLAQREQPRLETYINQQETELERIQDELADIRRQISALVRDLPDVSQGATDRQARERVIGGLAYIWRSTTNSAIRMRKKTQISCAPRLRSLNESWMLTASFSLLKTSDCGSVRRRRL